MVGLVAALTIWAAVVLACAALTRPDGRHRQLAIGLALASMPAAFLVPAEWVIGRFILAGLTALAVGRSLDLALREHSLSYLRRVWMFVALFDVRHARPGPRDLDRRELVWLVGHAGLLAIGWLGVFEWAPQFADWRYWLIRWATGLLLCYGLVESAHSTLLILYRAIGIHHIRINVFPIVSTTLGEFWGRRWNRVVSGWLRDYAFTPLVRRGYPKKLGIVAAFATSSALHVWISGVPLGIGTGLMMGSFFFLHAAALMIERALGIPHWPLPQRRAWTVTVLVVTSPLFVDPMLRILAALAS